MNIKSLSNVIFALFILGISISVSSCGNDDSSSTGDNSAVESKRAGMNEVVVRESSNPDKIFPILSTAAASTYVEGKIFMALMGIDPRTFEYQPILAKSRPAMEENENGGWNITYELRKEAVWDNGDPVTAADIDFGLKMIKNPHTNCEQIRPYYEFITDIIMYEDNPKKFTFVTKDKYFMSEIWSAVTVYPEYNYDPEKIMRNYTLKELSDPANNDKFMADQDLKRFSDNIHQDKYGRDGKYVVGCGPYYLEAFQTGQRVIVKKKENWWGDALMGEVKGFEAYPEKVTYEIIEENATAITALKGEGIDVMRGVRPKDFKEMEEDEEFQQLFSADHTVALQYSYIGLNMKHPILKDKQVRQALALTIDKQYIIDILMYGYAVPTVGPINPSKPYYNDKIEGYKFDLKKAKELLAEAGWADTDGDNILDKVIDGAKTPFELTYTYPSGGEISEQMGLKMKENMKKIGCTLNIVAKEFTVMIDDNKNHNFDMFAGGWVSAPTLADLKQIWHTQSYNGGSNYVGFGNAYTDELIEKIRYENDEEKRNEMYMEIQEIIHDEVPYIFLMSTFNRIVLHKRFANAEAVVTRPGYIVEEFQLDESFGTL